ncbi:helix-turn-helix domain-containing protein [Tenacibaculum ovolyticum]|uniref:helix-turn-helix domain-containing protein n=1 Tax=Tenacibaculum ovolyticum TaxID=104270 RepID=UPI003BAB63A8
MEQEVLDFNLLTILDVLSIATAFMLGLLFMTSKTNNRKANVFLGMFLWCLSIEVLDSFIQIIDNLEVNLLQTSLFTIPFLFLYINQTLNKKNTWYFLLFFVPGIFLNSISYDVDAFKYFEYLFNIIILFYVLRVLKKHKDKINDFYSEIENKTLSWIKAIVYVFLFFHLLWIVEDLVGLQNEEFIQYFAYASNILTFFMIYWIGYNGFSQSEMFISSLFLVKEKEEEISEIGISETSTQFLEISAAIQQRKLFTKPNLNLRSLSVELNIKEKDLSRLINLHTQNNFYHFINQFKVDEFKNLLLSEKARKLSLLGVAEEAGFYSKSTFYKVFKAAEGMTPKQYQNLLKKSE